MTDGQQGGAGGAGGGLTAATPFDANLVPEASRGAFADVKTMGDLVTRSLDWHGKANANGTVTGESTFQPEIFGPDVAKMMNAKGIKTVKGLTDWAVAGEKLHGDTTRYMQKPEPGKMAQWFKDNKASVGGVDNPNDYKWNKPQLPEGIAWDDQAEVKFRQFAFDRGLPQEMFQDFADLGIEMLTGSAKAEIARQGKAHTDLQGALKQEWGDNAAKNVEIAQFAARQLGVDGALLDKLDAEMTSPGMLKLFHMLGAKMEGAATITGDGRTLANSADQARSELARREADPNMQKAFLDKNSTSHAAEVAEREKLNKLIYPS